MRTVTEPVRTPSPPSPTPAANERPPVMLPDGRPNLSLLEDQCPDRFKASRSLAIYTAVLGLLFLCLSRLAVRLTDVWGHLAYGRWILAEGHLPETEPLLPLSQGVPWVDTAWLSKVIGTLTFNQFGIAGLQFIHAVAITTAMALLVWVMHRRTQSVGWTLLGLLAFGLVDYQQLLINRPQDFGLVAFVVVLAWGWSGRRHRGEWILLPLLFAGWANMHGSFAVGLAALGAFAVGRAVDIYRRTRRLKCVFASRLVWRPVLMLELCATAALLNPQGLRIYADILIISNNPNLATLVDWSPLNLRMGQGQLFAIAAVLIGGAYRVSPRRVSATELLLLIGLGAAALWSLRMLIWWGPVAGYLLALHGAAAWRRARHLPLLPAPADRRGLWSVVTVGLVWISFAYTPFGLQRLHGMPTGPQAEVEYRRSVVNRTPLEAVAYLRKNAATLPRGVMYNSQEFGDYLQWAVPEFPVFVNSHAHLVPEEVWNDFVEIHDGAGNWRDKLNRYGVNIVLVDTTNYAGLIRALRDEAEWREVFTDQQGLAVMFVRKRPI